MKVAVIIERYDISLGGAEWLAAELVLALSNIGVDVDILAAHGKKTSENVHILCGIENSNRISLAAFSKTLQDFLRNKNYDILHSLIPLPFTDVYQPPGGSFAEAFIRNAESYRNRFVVSYKKATGLLNIRRTEMLLAEKRLCTIPNGPVVTALSKYVVQQFRNHYNLDDEHLVLIPNGVRIDNTVNTSEADKLRKEIFKKLALKKSDNPIFLLFGANNFRLKGLDVLIEAMGSINKAGTLGQAYLIVAGSGKINKFRHKAQKHNIDSRIIFLGHQPSIQNTLSFSDIAVLPSFYDPCSRFILEGLAAGKPVITSKYNGATDFFVNNRHGKVINNLQDCNELAEAIQYFTNQDNIKQAAKAITDDKLNAQISIDRTAGQLMPVYESILQRKKQK